MSDTGTPGKSGGRAALAFATCACCMSALALAFALGRHWPLTAEPQRPVGTRSLREVQQRGAIPLAEIQIDRGTQSENMQPAAPAAPLLNNSKQAADRAAMTGDAER